MARSWRSCKARKDGPTPQIRAYLTSVDADAILDHCRARLAKFKTPASVVITTEIPRTASAKVQKHVLKQRAADEMKRA